MEALGSSMLLRGTPVYGARAGASSGRASLRARAPAKAARAGVSVRAQAVSSAPASKAVKAVTKDEACVLYEDMYLGRAFEDMCAQMYYRGKMFGFVHLYNGQEAVSTGIITQLRKDDYVCSTYRDHVHALSKGVPPREVMAELFGRTTGVCRGQGGSMHMFSKEWGVLGGYAFIGEGIPVATGAAFRTRYLRDVLKDEKADQVTVAFFGDGTANNGAFYECLNMASLYKLPIIYCVENNLWAIGMYHPRATAPSMGDSKPHIWKKGEPFGMPGVLVDGMDVLKVREVAAEAIARCRRGDGPTLIEAETYRFRGHSLADPDELRSKEEKEFFAKKDPIPMLEQYMISNGLATKEELTAIRAKVDAKVEDSVEFADASPQPERAQLLENVFADPRGFGIASDGKYHYERPGFAEGTANV